MREITEFNEQASPMNHEHLFTLNVMNSERDACIEYIDCGDVVEVVRATFIDHHGADQELDLVMDEPDQIEVATNASTARQLEKELNGSISRAEGRAYHRNIKPPRQRARI